MDWGTANEDMNGNEGGHSARSHARLRIGFNISGFGLTHPWWLTRSRPGGLMA